MMSSQCVWEGSPAAVLSIIALGTHTHTPCTQNPAPGGLHTEPRAGERSRMSGVTSVALGWGL